MDSTKIFTISHLPTVSDVMEKYSLADRINSGSDKKALSKAELITLCIFILFAAVVAVFLIKTTNLTGFLSFIAVGIVLLFSYFCCALIKKLMSKSRAKKAYYSFDNVSRAKKLTLYDDRLEIAAGDSHMTYPIENVTSAINSANCFIICIGSANAIQIPKRLLDAAQLDDTIDLLKQKCKQNYCELK